MGQQKKFYTLSIYLSRNTLRWHPMIFKTKKSALDFVRLNFKSWMFDAEAFHGEPIRKAKVAIESGRYPDASFELWEYVEGHDEVPVKTEWN